MTTTVRHATRLPAFHLKPCLLAVALAVMVAHKVLAVVVA